MARGNIQPIIKDFPSWAAGSQAQCVQTLTGKGIGGDLNALCAWLKDRSTGTTFWRGKGKKADETPVNQSQPYWFKDYSKPERDAAVKSGHAMKGGRYPINNLSDLKNAMRAIGRTPASGRASVKAHIRQMAAKLGLTNALTPAFKASEEANDSLRKLYCDITVAHKAAHDHFNDDGTSFSHTHQHAHEEGAEDDHDDDMHTIHHAVMSSYGEPMVFADITAGMVSNINSEPDDNLDDGDDPPYDGTHTHEHADYGVDDGDNDGSHSHSHTHTNDSDHQHSHTSVTFADPGMAQHEQEDAQDAVAVIALIDKLISREQSEPGDETADVATLNKAKALMATFKISEISEGKQAGDPTPSDVHVPVPVSGVSAVVPPHLADFITWGAGTPQAHAEDPCAQHFLDPVKYCDCAPSSSFCEGSSPQMAKEPYIVFTPTTVVSLPAAFRDVADMCSHRINTSATSRLFVEIHANAWQKFVESGNRMPYLPKPGIYQHPQYGTIVITHARNRRFVENMNNHVYQSRIPLDLSHETKLSGAAAWITSLVMNEDGSADAMVDIEPMGKKMLEENRYLFISPEWWDEWVQPHTGITFNDVPIGGALVTRPFFKDSALRSLVASEAGITIIDRQTGGVYMAHPNGQTTPAQTTPAVVPVQMSEAQAQQFAEMQQRLAAAEEKNKVFSEQLAASAVTTKAMAEKTRRKEFSDEVMGRSDDNGTRWFIDASLDAEGKPKGSVEGHVKFMEQLAEAFGEESEQLRQYVEMNRQHARQMEEGALLKQQGRTGMQTSEAAASGGKMGVALTRIRAAEPTITIQQAMAKAFNEDPSLYEDYLKANPRQHG